jgi:hypothetical protein
MIRTKHNPTMNLDKNTFGKAPAAMYLVVLLQERDNQALTRKVARVIESFRELLNDIVACHYQTEELKTASFNKLLEMMHDRIKIATAQLPDEFIGHIVRNILTGELKTLKRRAARTGHLQSSIARKTPSGWTVPMVKATPLMNEPSEEERMKQLQAKSSAYLARKGKKNTLY